MDHIKEGCWFGHQPVHRGVPQRSRVHRSEGTQVSYSFLKFKVIRRMNMSNGILMTLCSFVEITWVVETCRTPSRFFFIEQKTQPAKQFVILQPHNHATFLWSYHRKCLTTFRRIHRRHAPRHYVHTHIIPNYTPVGQQTFTVQAEINLRPQVKYSVHCVHFHL